MSTKPTEHTAYGSPAHQIANPAARKGADQVGSYVIAARVLPRNPERLTFSAMSAVAAVRSVREAVLSAAGLGEGLAAPGTSSVRGRLVRVLDPEVHAEYGCVLTCHAYSAARRYQMIVPIIDRFVKGTDGHEILEPIRWDVVPGRQPWWDALPFQVPMVDTAELTSLSEAWRRSRERQHWLKPQIEVLHASIDPVTLVDVEAALSERLSQ